jgi:hypothetical protein
MGKGLDGMGWILDEKEGEGKEKEGGRGSG